MYCVIMGVGAECACSWFSSVTAMECSIQNENSGPDFQLFL